MNFLHWSIHEDTAQTGRRLKTKNKARHQSSCIYFVVRQILAILFIENPWPAFGFDECIGINDAAVRCRHQMRPIAHLRRDE